jgi:hypothetical protein
MIAPRCCCITANEVCQRCVPLVFPCADHSWLLFPEFSGGRNCSDAR